MALPQHDHDNAPVGLRRLATEALEECDGDRDQAVAVLWRWLEGDAALYERLIRPMVEDALYSAVRAVDKSTRTALRSIAAEPLRLPVGPALRPPNPDRGIAGIVASVERTMHDYPLPGGKRLGDATADDLLGAARHYRTQERANAREARFYELVHEAMQGGSRVSKVLPDASLKRLRRQADGE